LMRGARNSDLYGPLQDAYLEGKKAGTDEWIHKNRCGRIRLKPVGRALLNKRRMSGLWGPQTALDLYLQEQGITTLFFGGVNADQVRRGEMPADAVAPLTSVAVRFGHDSGLVLPRIRPYPRQGRRRHYIASRRAGECYL
jgi:hypothetical protein